MENVVLISGGSKGLGLTIAEECLRQDWRVVTFSRSPSPAMERLCSEHGERFFYVRGDLTDRSFPQKIVRAAKQRFGRLDALVNNAAIATDGVLATMPPDAIAQLIDVNLTGVILLTREVVREFLRMPVTQPKSIVNLSSIVGISGFRGLSAYSSTKSAMLGFTRSLARELGPANVTVNALLPGFLTTEMSHSLSTAQRDQIVRRTPLGRLGGPEDVVPVVQFLLGPQARFITGQSIVVDGGATC